MSSVRMFQGTRLPAMIVTLFLFASTATGQTLPPRRAHHALAYDEARERVVLTGGSTPTNNGRSFTFFNDLWEFDGARWTRRAPSGDRLSGMALAYDAKRKRLLSFGGYNGSASLGDLRVLENNTWRSLGQHTAMPAAEPGLVYDTARERLVAFGGSCGRGQAHGETWEHDGSTWNKLSITSPPPRQSHVMVYDEKRGRTVVFGGMGSATPGQPPPAFEDTWEFDGQTWTQHAVPGPSARNGAGATYDSKRGLVILFGGSGSDGFKGDTWSWDGTQWKRLATTGPDARAMGYLAYDKRRDRVVLFGGRKGYPNGDLNDTWEWDGTRWRRLGN